MRLKSIVTSGLFALTIGCAAKANDGLAYVTQENGLSVPNDSVLGYVFGVEREWKNRAIDKNSCALIKTLDRNFDGKKDAVWLFLYDCGEYRGDWKKPERYLIVDRDKDGLADDVYIDLFNKDGLRFADGLYEESVFADTFYIMMRKESPTKEDLIMNNYLNTLFLGRGE